VRLTVSDPGRSGALAAAAALAVALIAALAVGPMGLLAPLAVLAVLVVLCNPQVAVGLLVGCAILFESSSPNVLHFTTGQFHDPLPGHYGVLELLMVLAVCAVLLDAIRLRRVPLRPAPFGPALGVLTLAILAGSITGHYAGQGFNAITEQIRPMLPLIIVPWLIVNVVHDVAELRRAIGLLAIFTAVKAALGLLGVLAHVGVTANNTTITYYEPAANWLTMTFLLAMLAAAAGRLPMERAARWAVPVVLLCLVLSLRRSFWLGTVAGAAFVLMVATVPVGKRFLLPGTVALAVAVWILISSGLVINSQSALGQRLESITPARIESNPEDSYRLDEQKNVLAEIRSSPLVGLGLAVPWQETYPLSVEQPGGGELYVHMALLWFWLKLGVLGVIAYLGYMLTAIVAGVRVFRRHPDARIRVAAVGAAGGLLGLAVVEATATFLGTDLRTTVLVGCTVGLLSVALGQIRPSAPLAPAPAVADQRLAHRDRRMTPV
jgi:O-Antigen ligase